MASKNKFWEFELTITVIGILFQLGNTLFAFKQAYAKPKYNSLIAVSMLLYLCAFFPLLRSTGLTITQVTDKMDELQRDIELRVLLNIHNVFFCVSTLLYTIVIQSRLQCLRLMVRYPKWVDFVALGFTILVWIVLCLVNVIILPYLNGSSAMLCGAIWSGYVILMDNIVAFVFLSQLLQTRSDLGLTVSKKQQRKRRVLITSLVFLAIFTWISLLFPFLSFFVYRFDPELRRISYRLGFCFSPIMYLGSLIFVYSVRAIFSIQHEPEIASVQSEKTNSIITDNKDYAIYRPKPVGFR
jgi:hypothetical protein